MLVLVEFVMLVLVDSFSCFVCCYFKVELEVDMMLCCVDFFNELYDVVVCMGLVDELDLVVW